MPKPLVEIISPALAADNNGNWQTAQRWAHFLEEEWSVSIARELDAASGSHCLVALHARRSASAIRSYRHANPHRPIILILTGTDLYRDIQENPEARESLDLASHLVLLQSEGLAKLPEKPRSRAVVVHQSAPALIPIAAVEKATTIVAVGHLRSEKDPLTAMGAFQSVNPALGVSMTHIGAALDATLGARATALAAANNRYTWRGALDHEATREMIRQAKLLVITSVMEGGANVVIEAITSGTPVLASHISGNVGVLGRDYPGYFPVGDAPALAALIERCAVDAVFYERLAAACARRAPLFSPEREREEVIKLVRSALAPA